MKHWTLGAQDSDPEREQTNKVSPLSAPKQSPVQGREIQTEPSPPSTPGVENTKLSPRRQRKLGLPGGVLNTV